MFKLPGIKDLLKHRCEYRTQLEALQNRVDQIAAENAELKEKLTQYENPKDSSNSSIPPSQDPHRRKYPKKEKSELAPGAQKGHKGSHHPWEENPDEIVPLLPQICQNCYSEDITLFPDYEEARQEIEIPPIKPFVREFRAFGCECNTCGQRSRAPFPEHLKGTVQIGTSIEDLTLYLKTEMHASHDKITAFLSDYLNLSVSHGWIHSALERCKERLQPLYKTIIEQLKKQAVLHSDETGCPVAGKREWFFVFAMENFCAYVAATTRGFKVIQETIGESFKGSWISDRYAAQLKIIALHQICLAHLCRELKWLIQAKNSIWALNMRIFLQKIIHTRNDYGEQWNPQNEEIKQLTRQFQDELDQLLSKPPSRAKKGKDKPKELILYEQLNIHKDKIVHFLYNPRVSPTNNLAERLLRSFVIHRKVNGEFKTIEGAQGHAIFRSIFQTARLQGKNIFDVLSFKQSLIQSV